MSSKTAVVMSGGGAKGAFQVGVLKKLIESGMEFDCYYGTSVGALNAAAMGCISIAKLEEHWLKIQSINDCFKLNLIKFFWSSGVYSLSPMRKTLTGMFADFPVKTRAVACNVKLDSGAVQYIDNQKSIPDYIDAVLGSASIPFIMEPVSGAVDGGVRQQTPLSPAIHDGYSSIIVILCNPFTKNPEPWTPPSGGFLPMLKIGTRALDIMSHQIFISDINKCLSCNGKPEYHDIDLTVYAPSEPLYDTLEFAPAKIKMAIEKGYRSEPIQL